MNMYYNHESNFTLMVCLTVYNRLIYSVRKKRVKQDADSQQKFGQSAL